MGDQALAVASELAAGAPQSRGVRIYFDVLGRWFDEMPLPVGVVLLVALLVAFAAVAWKRRAIVRGTALLFGTVVVSSVVAWLAVTLMGALRAGVYWRAHPEVAFVAIYATVLFAALAILRTIGSRMSAEKLRAAFWFLFLLLGAAIAIVAPGAIIYFLFPPALVLAGIALRRWWRPADAVGGLVGLLFLYLTWGEMLAQLEEIFSPGPLWVVAPLASVIVVAALVEAQPVLRRAKPSGTIAFAALLGIIGWSAAAATPAYSSDHQQRFTIEHVTEFPTNRSSWSIINDGTGLPQAYSRFGKRKQGKLPFSERRRWLTPAPPAAGLRPPSIQLLGSIASGSERRMRLRLLANGAERITLVAPEEARIRSAGVAGFVRPIGDANSSGRFTITCTGRSCDGMELMIDALSAKPIALTLVGARNGLPASAAPLVQSRPPNARPQYVPDETLTISHVNL
jgi:hypothetical protein